MRPADLNIHEIIEAARGTCSIIDDHLPEGMEWSDLTSEDHAIIDTEIFLCDQCGWWCERGSEESSTEEHCNDCCPED